MTGLRGGCRQGWGTNGSPVRLRQAEKPTAGSVSCSEPTPKAWHRNPQARNHKREELLAPPALQGGKKRSLNGEGCVILCCEAISPDKNRTRSAAPSTAEPPEIRSKSLRRDRLCTGIALWATVQPG